MVHSSIYIVFKETVTELGCFFSAIYFHNMWVLYGHNSPSVGLGGLIGSLFCLSAGDEFHITLGAGIDGSKGLPQHKHFF